MGILPKKDQAAAPVKTSAVAKPANKPAGGQANEASMKALDLGCKLDLSEVKLEETMKCTGQELYNALTQKDMIQIFTGSEATISIKQTKDDTKVSIEQSGVPAKEVESTREGWQRYYFHAMKRSFGFGASLF